ncbi:MAG: hypothetical protein AB7E81_12975 [Hyphomicrobiaceae bacterium]
MKNAIIIAALTVVASTATASAQSYAETRIDRRGAKQNHRIEQGQRTGQLTVYEARGLKLQQARIHAMERHAKSDGYIDRREVRRIERAQDAASRRIAYQRHDRDRRGYWYRRWW